MAIGISISNIEFYIYDAESGDALYGPLDRLARDYKTRKAKKTVFDRNYSRNQIEKKIKPLMDEYGDWVESKANDIFVEPYLKKGRKKLPVTLDNMVDIMLAQSLRGGEKNLVFGLGQARSRGAKKFKSIEDMKADRDKLITKEEVEKLKKPNEEKFHELQNKVVKYYKWYDPNRMSFDSIDDFSKSIYDYYKGSKTANNMERSLAKNDYINVPDYLIEESMEFADPSIE